MNDKMVKFLKYGVPSILLVAFIIIAIFTWGANNFSNILVSIIVGFLSLVLFGLILEDLINKHKLKNAHKHGKPSVGKLVKIVLKDRGYAQNYVVGKTDFEVYERYQPVIQFDNNGKKVKYMTPDLLTRSQVLFLYQKGSVAILQNGEKCALNEDLSNVKEQKSIELPKDLALSDKLRARGLLFNRFNFYGSLFLSVIFIFLAFKFQLMWWMFAIFALSCIIQTIIFGLELLANHIGKSITTDDYSVYDTYTVRNEEHRYCVRYKYKIGSKIIQRKNLITMVDAQRIEELKQAGKSLPIKVWWIFSDINHKEIDKLI